MVAEVGRHTDVLFDGGIRRGTDVVMAMSLGAKAVLVGRPWMYGLAVNGEAGVANMLDILSQEIDRTLALIGAPSVAALDPGFIQGGSRQRLESAHLNALEASL